jgi:quercetin dioxygenase-like cupin family protein
MATTVEAYALSRDEGTAIWFLGTLMTLKATGEQTKGTYGLIEQMLPPGFSPPLHVHHSEDEAFYLLAGEASFTCGDQTLKAKPGSFIFFPRDIPHWFRIEGTEPARLLQFNFPAGLEHFFLEVGEPALELTLPSAEPPDLEKLVSTAAKYHLEILGPPPA